MPKDRTYALQLLHSDTAIANGGRAGSHRLMIEDAIHCLSTPRAKPHSLAFMLSIPHTPSVGLILQGLPIDYLPRLSSKSSKCAAHFHGSETSEGDQASFGYRTTRSPPARHLPLWQSPPTSSLSSGRPRLQLPVEPPKGETRLYHLEIVQHPLKAAEFGSAPLTRLPLAPPLIAQLHYRDRTSPDEVDGNDLPFLIAHLALYNADGSTAVDVIGPGGQTPSQQRLYGNLVSSPHILRNLQGRLGIYFLFPDVSIRWRGRFTLSVTLMRIPHPVNIAEQGVVLAQTRSHVFDVYAREEYVAPAQTPLTQYFLQQGVRISRLPRS
ncbi:hypothetical protein BDW22DRAFT_1233527 [Trametopsis cervina]|nr:hypothetical protein BDW22DRAFT_1233527 [Trametopsis cervina]